MTREKLEIELRKIGVSEDDYSINEGLIPNSYIIDEFNSEWRLFYYDEKGKHSDYKFFKNEEETYEHLLNLFKEDLKLLGKDKFR